MELQEAIGTSLEYFQELEHATRLLNHPGESLVLQTDFLYMVERVDICIEFLKSHVSYDYQCCRVCLKSRFFCPPPPPPTTTTTNWMTAKLQRGRSISHAFPAMYDAGHDSDQNVLRRLAQSSYAGRLTAIIRTGKPFSARHHSSPSSFYLAH